MNRLILQEAQWTQLKTKLLVTAPVESAAAVICSAGAASEDTRLLAREILYPDDDDYLERTEVRASLTPAFVARVLGAARKISGGLLFVHTHPWQDVPRFSNVDEAAFATLSPTLYRRAPGARHGFGVISAQGHHFILSDSEGRPSQEIPRVLEIGRKVFLSDCEEGGSPFLSDSYYDRNIRAFGKEGQRQLANFNVGVVGVGGTGSIVVEELSRLGVGKLLLIDPEKVEATNLNRLLGSRATDVGRPKVQVAGDAARNARPNIAVEAIDGSVIFENVARTLLKCDFVFCCTDSHGSRAVLNQLSYQYGIPMIDIGVRIDAVNERVQGVNTRVQMLAPGLPCLNCYPLLSPTAVRQDLMEDPSLDPYIVGFHEPQPAVISINAGASSSAVTMFLSAVTGLSGRARHLTGWPLEGIVRAAVGQPNPNCIVCSPEHALFKGDAWPMIWRKQ